MNDIQLKLCDIQGRLLELSGRNGFESSSFIEAFMLSDTAGALDSTCNRMQWAGEEYLLEEVKDGAGAALVKNDDIFTENQLYWIGYLYRYWHYYTGESSREIYRQAPVCTMKRNYAMFHTMDPALAVEKLKEIYNQKIADKQD